jgi:hypothetical protein
MEGAGMFDFASLRGQFPGLLQTRDGRVPIFLDGPAGTQVPQRVIDAVVRYYTRCNANVGGVFATGVESDAVLAASSDRQGFRILRRLEENRHSVESHQPRQIVRGNVGFSHATSPQSRWRHGASTAARPRLRRYLVDPARFAFMLGPGAASDATSIPPGDA